MERVEVKGERKSNRVTFNPTSINMGEKLYITMPSLDSNLSIVPGTTSLVYNVKTSNNKTWPLNNMGKFLVQGLQVKIGKDIVYENTAENVYRIYEDLWLSDEERASMTGYGITSEETRKSLSGTSGASTFSKTNGTLDTVLAKVAKKQRIKLGQVLDSHGLFSPNASDEVKYTLTLPSGSGEIADVVSGQTKGNVSLENLELEYDTIMNPSVVEKNCDSFSQGKNYIIQHVSLESLTQWDKDSTLVNENLHISRESLKAIVFLFKWTDELLDEKYIYPEITEVSCNVNGKPNVVHSNPMLADKFEKEAALFFGRSHSSMSTGKFFDSGFCIVMDFRGLGLSKRYGDGIKVNGTSGIQVTFRRKATAKNVKCYTFVVSDSIAQLDSSGYQKTLI